MTDDKFLLLRTHPCSRGLDDEVAQEIADATELVRYHSGDVVLRANQVQTTVDLVIHGRLLLKLTDVHGNLIMERFVSRGGQYGGLSAALSEPAPVECIAADPTTILHLDYQVGLELTQKHDAFRQNMMRLLADGVKQTLFSGRTPVKPQLVAMFHQSEKTREFGRKLIKRLVALEEEPCVLTDQLDWEPIENVRHRSVHLQGANRIDEDEARRQINEWSDAPRIIIDVESSLETIRATRILNACDLVLWCVTPATWRESVAKLETIESQAPSWRDKVCVVWLLDNESVAPVSNELTKLAKRDIKVSFADPGPHQGTAMNQGFERVVHLLRGVQIGVALGGGAARGMAHLGVLKALEQSGIVVDMIAGTSAGAMTGTLFASGMDVDYSVDCFVHDLRPSWLFRHLPSGDQWFLLYKYRRGHFDPMLRKYLHDYQLEQLPVPMNSITVDLISGKVVVRDVGDAVHGIVESINLPVLSAPIIRQGQALVDGGMINNVPADVLVAKGCNFVIAVSVTAKMEMEFARNRPDTPVDNMKSPSTLQTILRTYLVQSASVNALGVQPADIVIEPDVTQFKLTDFVKTDKLSAVGESTTLAEIPKIKGLLLKLDPQLFPATPAA